MQRLTATVADSRFASRQRVLGWVTDPARYFQALAMLAMPSLSPETFGRVSAEAQASGVPVLVSDVGGAAETLQDGTTGMLLPAGTCLRGGMRFWHFVIRNSGPRWRQQRRVL